MYQSCISGCRILKEERNYILQMIKKIRASGANVLLIQKSILRDAVTDLSLHYLVCSLFPAFQFITQPMVTKAPKHGRMALVFQAACKSRGLMHTPAHRTDLLGKCMTSMHLPYLCHT